MLELTNITNKFNYDKAIHYATVVSADGEELRHSVKGTEFGCCVYEAKRIGQRLYAEGITGHTSTVAIMTNDHIAQKIREDDVIVWRNKKWFVDYVIEKRTQASMISKVYIIGLK